MGRPSENFIYRTRASHGAPRGGAAFCEGGWLADLARPSLWPTPECSLGDLTRSSPRFLSRCSPFVHSQANARWDAWAAATRPPVNNPNPHHTFPSLHRTPKRGSPCAHVAGHSAWYARAQRFTYGVHANIKHCRRRAQEPRGRIAMLDHDICTRIRHKRRCSSRLRTTQERQMNQSERERGNHVESRKVRRSVHVRDATEY